MRGRLYVCLAVAAAVLYGVPAGGAPAPASGTNRTLVAGTNRVALPLAFPLPSRSPVESFRELLAMPRAERAQALAGRSPESRKMILAKLREYESLKPDQRELRLKVTELRWYLLPLMHSSSTNRGAQLERIPESMRDLVATRIAEWEALDQEVRSELLQNEATLQYFTEMDSPNPPALTEARRQKLEAGIAQWQALPEERRRQVVLQFNKFFELSPEEKSRTLSTLSEAERRQIEKTLKSYGNLPPEQREQCVQSFSKFARLSLEERQEFLKNAERWKLLSPEERQAWRELVSRLSSQPPLPVTAARPSPAELIRQRIKAAPLPIGTTNRVSSNGYSPRVSQGPDDERISSAPRSSPPAKAKPVKE